MAVKPASPQVDLTEFEALSTPKRMKCGVYKALKVLTAPQRRQLEAALATPPEVIKHSAIAAWLAKREVKVGTDTITRHRRGVCSCDG